PLLGRAFALYDVVSHDDSTAADCVEFVYLVGGKMTSAMSRMQPGQQLDIWGPLGNGFPELNVQQLILVAGGIGQTPFLATGKSYLGKQAYGSSASETSRANRVTLCYGARTADYLAGVDDFRWAGMDVRISTDDGSHGHHGLVTETLRHVLSESSADSRAIFCCGPEPMMHAVANVAEAENVRCFVSLEAPMACGIGICFTCVTKVKMPDGTWDFKRTCVEGPIFDAEKLEWD
ncbi:MAG: dihydroorotate dehydrogenase electron transfer subunit, partial [Planctomycetales bacterium]|nr:dihydroorotate dehydrogenase electron transfer subunit [Planctomycetales bacterium]